MRFRALAVDYDGTLATRGQVPAEALAALRRVKASGRKLILVTGRTLADVRRVFGDWNVFDRIVAENGGVLYQSERDQERSLAPPPPAELVAALEERGVAPLHRGHVLVATVEPHQTAVLEAINDLGIEYHIAFNKGSMMVLPSGVTKKTGLLAALETLGLSQHNVVGIGDAENDHAFLDACECAVAVANALPAVKERADVVTRGAHAEGVIEIVNALIDRDLGRTKLRRTRLRLGTEVGRRRRVELPAYGTGLLVAGTPRAGKSTLVLGLFEAIRALGYQLCLVDPEGDYERLPNMIALGDAQRAPSVEEVVDVLEDPDNSVSVSLLGISGENRPRFFGDLVRGLTPLHLRTGRPHWMLLDEAHHLVPADALQGDSAWPWRPGGLVLVTISPPHLAAPMRDAITHVLVLGDEPTSTVHAAAEMLGEPAPRGVSDDLKKREGFLWRRGKNRVRRIRLVRSRIERQRHRRKYAEGELPDERSFYFTGPDRALNLRAQNLQAFMQLGEGVDAATWEHHRRANDYSTWIGTSVKDEKLARRVKAIEDSVDIPTDAARARLRALIEKRYAPPP
jgi:hydroxymethylpyrimidine pyrophosphatase-like HAD family hydrolase